MRKTTFWTLALLMVSALMSMGLSSCSSDDDDDDNGVPSALLGRWEGDDNNWGDYAFEFKSGGKGFAESWGPLDRYNTYDERWAITYFYNESTKELIIHDAEDGDNHEYDDKYLVVELTSKKLSLKLNDESYSEYGKIKTYHKK